MNKKGQLDYPIITFVIIAFGLILLAPLTLKVFNSIKTPMAASLGNISGGDIAQGNFNKVMDTAVNFWDKVVIAAFILALILLLISAFLIDTNPFWIILYIFLSFMLILFAPSIMSSLDNIYDSAGFSTEVGQLTFVDSLRVNFPAFLIGVMVVTGIIIYGKIRFFGSGGNR